MTDPKAVVLAKKTVILARVSTSTDQSTQGQVLAGTAWCVAHGYKPEIRTEDGVHGDALERPELERIMDEARAGLVGVLCVAAIDRLGRSAVDLIMRLDELRKLGVRVVSLREGIDLGSPIGSMIAAILAYVAELELHSIRERTKAGLNGWELDGHPCDPGTPGAVRVAVRSRKKLGRRPLRFSAAADAELLALLADCGGSVNEVARRVKAAGHPTATRQFAVDAAGARIFDGGKRRSIEPAAGWLEEEIVPSRVAIFERLRGLKS